MQSPQNKMLSKTSAKGFTLIELMMAVAIIAIIVGIAAPNFAQFTARQLVKTQANDLQGFLVNARGEAIARIAAVHVCWNFGGAAWAFPAATGIDGANGVIPPNSISSAIDSNPDLLVSSIALSNSSNIIIQPVIDGDVETQDCTQFSPQGFLVTGSNQVTFNVSDQLGENRLDTQLTTTGRTSVKKHE